MLAAQGRKSVGVSGVGREYGGEVGVGQSRRGWTGAWRGHCAGVQVLITGAHRKAAGVRARAPQPSSLQAGDSAQGPMRGHPLPPGASSQPPDTMRAATVSQEELEKGGTRHLRGAGCSLSFPTVARSWQEEKGQGRLGLSVSEPCTPHKVQWGWARVVDGPGQGRPPGSCRPGLWSCLSGRWSSTAGI